MECPKNSSNYKLPDPFLIHQNIISTAPNLIPKSSKYKINPKYKNWQERW
jgi:hypothetical protein